MISAGVWLASISIEECVFCARKMRFSPRCARQLADKKVLIFVLTALFYVSGEIQLKAAEELAPPILLEKGVRALPCTKSY